MQPQRGSRAPPAPGSRGPGQDHCQAVVGRTRNGALRERTEQQELQSQLPGQAEGTAVRQQKYSVFSVLMPQHQF